MSSRSLAARVLAVLLAPLAAAEAGESGRGELQSPAFTRRDYSLYDAGRYVYEQHCIVCHGARGDGRGEMADSVGVKPRSFASGQVRSTTFVLHERYIRRSWSARVRRN